MSAITFNATAVAPDTGMSPAPRGYYKVMMIESELKPTKRGDGEIIATKLQVCDGPFTGKTIPTNFNWKNRNATAQNIGHAQFSAVCHAVNVLAPQDTVQLHNIPFGIEVDVTADGKYNDVKSFMAADAVDTMPPMAASVVGLPLQAAPAPLAAPAPAPVAQAVAAPAPVVAPPMQAPPAQQPVTAAPAFPQGVAQPPQQVTPAPQAVVPTPLAPVTTAPTPAQTQTSPSNVAPVAQAAAPTAETPPWIAAQQAAAAAQAPV